MRKRLTFIRHGKTQGNLERRYIGRTDEPLCPLGRQELEQRQYPPCGEQLFVSPMLRCIQTAQLIFPGHPFLVVEDFRECDFGIFEGHTYEELQEDSRYRQWLDSMGQGEIPGGESSPAFRLRCQDAFARLLPSLLDGPEETLSFVVHGGTIMALFSHYTQDADFYRWQIPNGEWLTGTLDTELWKKGICQLQVP